MTTPYKEVEAAFFPDASPELKALMAINNKLETLVDSQQATTRAVEQVATLMARLSVDVQGVEGYIRHSTVETTNVGVILTELGKVITSQLSTAISELESINETATRKTLEGK